MSRFVDYSLGHFNTQQTATPKGVMELLSKGWFGSEGSGLGEGGNYLMGGGSCPTEAVIVMRGIPRGYMSGTSCQG